MRNPSDPVTPPEPRPLTATGQSLFDWLDFARKRQNGIPLGSIILAIEAEARALPSTPTDRIRELAEAWDAYRDDDANYERLAAAIGAVLGRAKSAERIALETATAVRLDDLPSTEQPFTFREGSRD